MYGTTGRRFHDKLMSSLFCMIVVSLVALIGLIALYLFIG